MQFVPGQRLYKLNPDTVKTLDDMKKVLAGMDIIMHESAPNYQALKEYFTIEFNPPQNAMHIPMNPQ
jgi:hypothetical protein